VCERRRSEDHEKPTEKDEMEIRAHPFMELGERIYFISK